MSQDNIINISVIARAKSDNITVSQKSDTAYEEMQARMNSILLKELKAYNVNYISFYRVPFFITGNTLGASDSFSPHNSEYYHTLSILNSLTLQSKKNYEAESFSLPVNPEHIPTTRNNTTESEDSEVVVFRFAVVLSDNTKALHDKGTNLALKDDINEAMKNFFIHYVLDLDYIGAFTNSPNMMLAQETIFKAIQYTGFSRKNGNALVRVDGNNTIKTNQGGKEVEATLNTFYVRGDLVILPCYSHEEFTEILRYMEKQVGVKLEEYSEAQINELRKRYVSFWMDNYMQLLTAKKTLEALGYQVIFVRADLQYTLEGNILDINEALQHIDRNEAEKLDLWKNREYNIKPFHLKSSEQLEYEEILYVPQVIESSLNGGTLLSNEQDIVFSLHVTKIKDSYIAEITNYYGDISQEEKDRIEKELQEEAKQKNVKLTQTNSLSSFIKDSEMSVLIAQKPS